jgi:hypothetical protein
MLDLRLRLCKSCEAYLPLSEFNRRELTCRDCKLEIKANRTPQERVERLMHEKLTVPMEGYQTLKGDGECVSCELDCYEDCTRYPELICDGCPCLICVGAT